MITFVSGDIFVTPPSVGIAHGCNMRGLMGAGVAYEIRRRYPETLPIYETSCRLNVARLGSHVTARGADGRYVFHLFTQREPGPDASQVSIALAVKSLVEDLRNYDSVTAVVMPLVGSGIGGVGIEEAERAIQAGYESVFGPLVDLYVVNSWVRGVDPIV